MPESTQSISSAEVWDSDSDSDAAVATVEEVDLQRDRLHYKRLTGAGPAEGWVSLKLKAGTGTGSLGRGSSGGI